MTKKDSQPPGQPSEGGTVWEQANTIRSSILIALKENKPYRISVKANIVGQLVGMSRSIQSELSQKNRGYTIIPSRKKESSFWFVLLSQEETRLQQDEQGLPSLLRDQYENLYTAIQQNNFDGAIGVWNKVKDILQIDPRTVDQAMFDQRTGTVNNVEIPTLFDEKYFDNFRVQETLTYMRNRVYALWMESGVPIEDRGVAELIMDMNPDHMESSLFLIDLWGVIGAVSPGIQMQLKDKRKQPVHESWAL